jgi:hypothetical protein
VLIWIWGTSIYVVLYSAGNESDETNTLDMLDIASWNNTLRPTPASGPRTKAGFSAADNGSATEAAKSGCTGER